MIRIVVAIDVDVKSADDAYALVYDAMGKLEKETHGVVQWESTDEWYDADGNQLSESEVQRCRMVTLKEIGETEFTKAKADEL